MNLFPKSSTPYLVLSPSYTHASSGVRTLHLLVHALNESGQKAYIVQDRETGYALNPDLNTPSLTGPHWEYLKENQSFIAVYPDIVKGNPLNAKHVVRYLLAPRGAYGGDAVFPDTDQVWGALPTIADNVLRLPVSDPNIFYPPLPKGLTWSNDKKWKENYQKPYAERSGSCFYSHKYEMHGNKLLDMPPDCERVCGTLEQVADILRRKEVCYLYEVSSILTEAALCGCPVVLQKTDYFNTIDPTCMMGNVKWSDGVLVKDCSDFKLEYDLIMFRFWLELDSFVKKTKEML